MGMRTLEVVAVGLPFGIFKVLTGLRALEWFPAAPILGWSLIGLGIVDLAINGTNLVGLVFLKRRLLDTCFFAAAARLLRNREDSDWKWHDLGISLDTLLAMSIIAYMIGTNAFASFPDSQLKLWNACVILNVLFAGLARLAGSINRISDNPVVDRRAET